jgi:FkbM family methyltransferase
MLKLLNLLAKPTRAGFYKLKKLVLGLDDFGLPGVGFVFKSAFFPSAEVTRLRNRRLECDIYLRSNASDFRVYEQVFVSLEYDVQWDFEPEYIIDAGANIGLATVYFARKFTNAKIIALEPESSNFSVLQKNTADYPNVICVQGALWNVSKTLSVVDIGLGEWSFMTLDNNDSGHKVVGKVQTYTVDELARQYSLPWIDLLKIDIEGAEKEVFKEPHAWINSVVLLAIELHDRITPGCSRVFYNSTGNFEKEWNLGENVYLQRDRQSVIENAQILNDVD